VGGLQAGQFQVPHLVGAVGLPGGQCLCHDVVSGAPVGVPDLGAVWSKRFLNERLPISALRELERYQQLVADVAEAKWRRDHPRCLQASTRAELGAHTLRTVAARR